MREDTLWQLAEVLLPLRDDMRALRGTVGAMETTIHSAQCEIRRLHDEILKENQHAGTDALRGELHLARHELREFQNELRCIRALAIRQRHSLERVAHQVELLF